MHVHRLLIDSQKRLSGHSFDFSYDVSRLSTNQDFINGCHMVSIEMMSPIFYSEFQAAFSQDARHPASLLITWDRTTSNIYGQPNALSFIQQYEDLGAYGVTAELPYISRHTMGVIMQGDTLNKAGVLRFRVLQQSDGGFVPCQAPRNAVIFGTDFRFMLVFWSYPKPESPLAHTYFRIFLDTRSRISGSVANCIVPIVLSTNASMDALDNSWMVVVESSSLIKSNSLTAGLVLRSDTFRTSSEYSGNVLVFFPRSAVRSKAIYNQKLSIKQTTSDTIGVPISIALDQIRGINLTMTTEDGQTPEELNDYVVCLVIYKSSS